MLAFRCGSIEFVDKLFKTLLLPSLEYAAAVWDSCSKAESESLEKLQLSVARAVLSNSQKYIMKNKDLLQRLHWPTLSWRRRRVKLLLLWKVVNGQGPPSLRERLPQTSNTARTTHCLRNSQSLAFLLCSSAQRLRSFLPSAIALWNSPPSSISSCTSASSFLNKLNCLMRLTS